MKYGLEIGGSLLSLWTEGETIFLHISEIPEGGRIRLDFSTSLDLIEALENAREEVGKIIWASDEGEG